MNDFRLKWAVIALLLFCGINVGARQKNAQRQSSQEYIERVRHASPNSPARSTPGSLWRDNGELANIASDYKAHSVGDLVVITILEQTLAQASGTVATQRTFNTSSAVTGLLGRINTGGVNPLVMANSDTQLKGQGQTASTSTLRSSVSGKVIAVLPSGSLVIEAYRNVLMNNERQTILLRGVARPGDLSPNNTVLSTQLSDLEVELRGKGVISEGTRQPNWIVRALLRLVSF